MKHRFLSVNLCVLGVICAAGLLQVVNCLDPPRFQVTAVPQTFRHGADNLIVFISMNCIPNITTLENFQSQWLANRPNGTNTTLSSSTDARIMIRQGHILDTNLPAGTNMIISRLSYLDGGTYSCEIQETDVSGTQISAGASAMVQLVLEVRLQSVDINNTIRTFNDSQLVELGCDMSGYIRPDEDLYWIVNGARLDPATNDGSKYRVSYRDGNNVAQFGGSSTVPSRVAVLTILDIGLADAGVYSCAINNTNLMNGVTLEVTPASRPSGYPQNVKVTVISSTSLQISWKEVPETERNGNITHYEILYTPVNTPLLQQQPKISITGGPVLDSVLENLEEFTNYSVSVRAVTIVGSGPPSPPQMNQTEEDAPSAPPRNLMIIPLDKNSLQVNWERPDPNDINGVLRLYKVEYCILVRSIGNVDMTDCTPRDVNGIENGVTLTSLKEGTMYSVSVAAYTVGPGPAAMGSATTGETQLPLQPNATDPPNNGATIAGIVIGVLLGAIALVLVASVVIGFVISSKLTKRQQHKQMPSTPVESQVASVVNNVRSPSPNLLPATVTIENGTLDHEIVGEEITEPITEPITSNCSLKKPTNATEEKEEEEEEAAEEEHLDVSVQPKLELSELLKDEPPQYNLFDPTPPAASETAGSVEVLIQIEEPETAVIKLNFDDDGGAAESAQKDDIDSPMSMDGEPGTETKQELMELLLHKDDQDSS